MSLAIVATISWLSISRFFALQQSCEGLVAIRGRQYRLAGMLSINRQIQTQVAESLKSGAEMTPVRKWSGGVAPQCGSGVEEWPHSAEAAAEGSICSKC